MRFVKASETGKDSLYQVIFRLTGTEAETEMERVYEEAVAWCREQFGPCVTEDQNGFMAWRWWPRMASYQRSITMRKPDDAFAFRMRWCADHA